MGAGAFNTQQVLDLIRKGDFDEVAEMLGHIAPYCETKPDEMMLIEIALEDAHTPKADMARTVGMISGVLHRSSLTDRERLGLCDPIIGSPSAATIERPFEPA